MTERKTNWSITARQNASPLVQMLRGDGHTDPKTHQTQQADQAVAHMKDKIRQFESSIKKRVSELKGVAARDVKVRIGIEVEWYQVADEETVKRRKASDGPKDGHDDHDMPEDAQLRTLKKLIYSHTDRHSGELEEINEGFRRGKGRFYVNVDTEPPLGMAMGTDVQVARDEEGYPIISEPKQVAFAQKEVISPPFSPSTSAKWMEIIGELITKSAKNQKLKRTEISSQIEGTLASGIHLNVTVQYKGKDGNMHSIFFDPDREAVPICKELTDATPHHQQAAQEGKNASNLNLHPSRFNKYLEREYDPEHNPNGWRPDKDPNEPVKGELTPLGYFIGNAINDVSKSCYFLFTRSSEAFSRRLKEPPPLAQSAEIGFAGRKVGSYLPTAMFRGAGKRAHRVEDGSGKSKPDSGPMRVELRFPDVSILGHPNKDAYPLERVAPYEAIAGLLYMVDKGIKEYKDYNKVYDCEKELAERPYLFSEAHLVQEIDDHRPSRNTAIDWFEHGIGRPYPEDVKGYHAMRPEALKSRGITEDQIESEPDTPIFMVNARRRVSSKHERYEKNPKGEINDDALKIIGHPTDKLKADKVGRIQNVIHRANIYDLIREAEKSPAQETPYDQTIDHSEKVLDLALKSAKSHSAEARYGNR